MSEYERIYLDIILGSTSDYPKVAWVIDEIGGFADVTVTISVLSCHRHPRQLARFAEQYPAGEGRRWVICCGSKAFALPGILKAWFNSFSKKVPVIGVALPGENQVDCIAAGLSISCLPGQPVLMDGNKEPYQGASGLLTACIHAIKSPVPEIKITESPQHYVGLTSEKAAELFSPNNASSG